ncbi:hypothetical protein AG1IA_02077 [Rhizoctonia solani AG-1 IA]|uniref:Uncharacterized protein n=1 Tax=Thanatephorus cucumeris (strain AG1-IA) TaxID=983506 RepID=L8X450_THACA|nr:hypothetical protein AG1IA_02077 [Rhizoctonia solani AG-1 IA]
MVNTPPPPAYEHEEYNHIVDYYDHTRDEDGPSASASSSAPVPSSNAAPPTQAPTLREGTMNGQAPRQTSLHEGDMLPAPDHLCNWLTDRHLPFPPTHAILGSSTRLCPTIGTFPLHRHMTPMTLRSTRCT